MWEWSEAVARQAAAASWTAGCQRVEPEPTIVDPEFHEEAAESAEYAEGGVGAMAAPIDNDVFVLVG